MRHLARLKQADTYTEDQTHSEEGDDPEFNRDFWGFIHPRIGPFSSGEVYPRNSGWVHSTLKADVPLSRMEV